MVEISKYGSGEGPGRVTGPGYSTGNDGFHALFRQSLMGHNAKGAVL
jgi:hypothetical protein